MLKTFYRTFLLASQYVLMLTFYFRVRATSSKVALYCYLADWLIKNCTNNGTGRPVAPLLAPCNHAVPAISK